jgi:hypothetical protein
VNAARVSIVDKIVALDRALESAGIPHAFGGALALAWCTRQARGTIDIDLNVFVESTRSGEIFVALPAGVRHDADDLTQCVRDGQVRLWWDQTPVDIFTNTTEFHDAAAERAVTHEFASREIPFLSCTDVAVFKAFFNRSKDWVDIEEMVVAGTLDADVTLGALVRYLGADDERIERLRDLIAHPPPDGPEPIFRPKRAPED